MSVEIILIPLAVAAVGAWKARRSADAAGARFVEVGTRMRNERLLELALGDTGASVSRHADEIVAGWGATSGRFTRDTDGIWSVHFPGDMDVETATQAVRQVDAAYGLRVQQDVVARLQERARTAGFEIESQRVEEDRSVTMVLTVEGQV